MNYRVALITNKSLHHKYWITEMSKLNNVVCIIHPNKKDNYSRKQKKIKSMLKEKRGWYTLMFMLTELFFLLSSKNSRKEFKKESITFFQESKERYEQIDKRIIYDVKTVNSPESIKIIKKLSVDIICFLGGDIAKTDFINSPRKMCLNFHSGLSPIYNGANSFAWAMSENRPNFIGGTLMKMTSRIDGGDIIAHYLPSINENDNASSLFMKTIIGSTKLYTEAISKIEDKNPLPMVRQERSIRYTKVIDWTIYQELQLKAFYKSNKITKYKRNSDIIWVNDKLNDKLFLSELFLNTLKFLKK